MVLIEGKGGEIGLHLGLESEYKSDWWCQFPRSENQLFCKSSVKMRLKSRHRAYLCRFRARPSPPLPGLSGRSVWRGCMARGSLGQNFALQVTETQLPLPQVESRELPRRAAGPEELLGLLSLLLTGRRLRSHCRPAPSPSRMH